MVGLSDFSKFKQVPTPESWVDWSNEVGSSNNSKNNSTNYLRNSLRNRRTLFNYIFQPNDKGQVGMAWRGEGCVLGDFVNSDEDMPPDYTENTKVSACEEIDNELECNNRVVAISEFETNLSDDRISSSRAYFKCQWGKNLYNDYSHKSTSDPEADGFTTLFMDIGGEPFKESANLSYNFGCCFADGSEDVVDKPSKDWKFHCRVHGETDNGANTAGPRCDQARLGRGYDHMVVPGNPATGLCEGGISKSIAEENEATRGVCQRFADLAGLPIIYLTDCAKNSCVLNNKTRAMAKTYPVGCSMDISGRFGGAVVYNDSTTAKDENMDADDYSMPGKCSGDATKVCLDDGECDGTQTCNKLKTYHWPVHYVPNSAVPVCVLENGAYNNGNNLFYKGPVSIGEYESLFYIHSDDPHQRYVKLDMEGGWSRDFLKWSEVAEEGDADWWNTCGRFGDGVEYKEFTIGGNSFKYCVRNEGGKTCKEEKQCAALEPIDFSKVNAQKGNDGYFENENGNRILNVSIDPGRDRSEYTTTERDTGNSFGIPSIYDADGSVLNSLTCNLNTGVKNVCGYEITATHPSSVANYYVEDEQNLPLGLFSNESYPMQSIYSYTIPDKVIVIGLKDENYGTIAVDDADLSGNVGIRHYEVSEQIADEFCYQMCTQWNETTKGPRCLSWVRSARDPEEDADYKNVVCRLNSQPLMHSETTQKIRLKPCQHNDTGRIECVQDSFGSTACGPGFSEVSGDNYACGWQTSVNVNVMGDKNNGQPGMYRDFSPLNGFCSFDKETTCQDDTDCQDPVSHPSAKCVGGSNDGSTDWIDQSECPWTLTSSWRGNNISSTDESSDRVLGCVDNGVDLPLKKCSDRNYQTQACVGEFCFGADAICCHDCTSTVLTASLLDQAKNNEKSIVDANACFEANLGPLRVQDNEIKECFCTASNSGVWLND